MVISKDKWRKRLRKGVDDGQYYREQPITQPRRLSGAMFQPQNQQIDPVVRTEHNPETDTTPSQLAASRLQPTDRQVNDRIHCPMCGQPTLSEIQAMEELPDDFRCTNCGSRFNMTEVAEAEALARMSATLHSNPLTNPLGYTNPVGSANPLGKGIRQRLFQKPIERMTASERAKLEDMYDQDQVAYTARDLEQAKNWLNRKPHLRAKFGSRYYQFAVQVATAIHRGEDPETIDWASYGIDISVRESVMGERTNKAVGGMSDLEMTIKEYVGFDHLKSMPESDSYAQSAAYRKLLWKYLSDISLENRTEIIRLLRKALTSKDNMREVGSKIGKLLDDQPRGQLIAQTEIIRITNEGNKEYMLKQGIDQVVWISAPEDGRLCRKCAALNGKIFKTETAPNPSDIHPRCRCVKVGYLGPY